MWICRFFFYSLYAPLFNVVICLYHWIAYVCIRACTNTHPFTTKRENVLTLQHFEDFVAGHFRKSGQAILVACRAYIDGAQVGCLVGGGVQDVDEGDKSCSAQFRTSLKSLFDELLMEFTVKGADCDEFLSRKLKNEVNGAADTTLKLWDQVWMMK